MGANVPQTLEQVQRLYLKLRREGLVRTGGVHLDGENVQARVRGAVLCGVVLGVVPQREDRPMLYAIVTQVGDAWVSPVNVRSCGAVEDGRCVCRRERTRGAPALAQRDRAPRALPPLGNTGGTV